MVEKNHVEIQNLWHRYGSSQGSDWVLKDIDINIKQGELVGLLGPSGCGKTTLLRLIAGFETPISGCIVIDGQEVAGQTVFIPPERRGVGMVFQDFALFPHLNSWDNACFGLKRSKSKDRVDWLLQLLGLQDLKARYPHELSGGQKQRLAVARALAPGSSLVLLDEPFSSLDVAVRLRLRGELLNVLKTCNASGIIVTHDPQEAIAICDQIAVLNDGGIHQYGTPLDLIERPETPFVSKFVLQSNLLPIWREGSKHVTKFGPVHIPNLQEATNDNLKVMVDENALQIETTPSGKAMVQCKEFHGKHWILTVKHGDQTFRIKHPLEPVIETGDQCNISLRKNQQGIFYPGAIQGVLS